MSRFTLVLLAIAAVFFVAANAQGCKQNEVFVECGTACPRKCNQPPPQICTLQCVIGCQCKPGYLLNSQNNCVKPEDC